MKHSANIQDKTAEEISVPSVVWTFFSSMKTAIALLLALAATSVVITLLEGRLGLTGLYHHWFYVSLLTLVSISLAVCSINRFGASWRRTFRPKVIASAEQIAGMRRSETLSGTGRVEDAASRAVTALRARSYHILSGRDDEDVLLYAAKGRLSIWGPYLTHLSILVIFAGAIIGNRFGFDGFMRIEEGESTSICFLKRTGEPRDLGFRVVLREFTIRHDEKRNPTGYKSHLRIYDGGKLAARKIIDVNHPLTYKGISFFQSDYGLAGLMVKVTGPGGETAQAPIGIRTQDAWGGKRYFVSGEPFKEVAIGGKKFTLFVHNIAPDYVGGEEINASFIPINPAILVLANDRFPEYRGLDAWSNLGWLAVSDSADYKGCRITVDKAVDYTVLQVVRNPGLPIVYTGFGLMLAGVFVSLYIAHKVIRIRISPSENGVTAAVGAMSRSAEADLDGDFARIREVFM